MEIRVFPFNERNNFNLVSQLKSLHIGWLVSLKSQKDNCFGGGFDWLIVYNLMSVPRLPSAQQQ